MFNLSRVRPTKYATYAGVDQRGKALTENLAGANLHLNADCTEPTDATFARD